MEAGLLPACVASLPVLPDELCLLPFAELA